MYSMAGMGVAAGSLKILTGVLVHRVTRPLRGSVSCGSGIGTLCVDSTDPFAIQPTGLVWSDRVDVVA